MRLGYEPQYQQASIILVNVCAADRGCFSLVSTWPVFPTVNGSGPNAAVLGIFRRRSLPDISSPMMRLGTEKASNLETTALSHGIRCAIGRLGVWQSFRGHRRGASLVVPDVNL